MEPEDIRNLANRGFALHHLFEASVNPKPHDGRKNSSDKCHTASVEDCWPVRADTFVFAS
jgi:hypothetical protein